MAHRGTPISPVLTDDASVQDMGPGGVLNQLPSLKDSSDTARKLNVKFNEYNSGNGQSYGVGHENAQSDGDEHGRGETQPAGGVGTKTDKMTKNFLLYSSGNKFKPGQGYNSLDFNEEYW